MPYRHIDPTELKILFTSVVGSMAFDMELILRFLIPVLSALTWYFIKGVLDRCKRKRKVKKRIEK